MHVISFLLWSIFRRMSQNLLIGMEAQMRDKEVQVAHLMACVYDEQNRTQVIRRTLLTAANPPPETPATRAQKPSRTRSAHLSPSPFFRPLPSFALSLAATLSIP